MFRKFLPFFIIAETPVHAGSGTELGIVDLPIQRERYTRFPKIEGSGIKGCIREAFECLTTKDTSGRRKLCESEISKKLKEKYKEIEDLWKEKDEKGQEFIVEKNGEKLINYDKYISLVFGPEEGEVHAGSIAFTDAKILLFPVKSLKGVFAWITCPMVLERFVEDMKFAGKEAQIKDWNLTNIVNTVPKQTNILISGKVVLEEFTFEVREDENTAKIAEMLAKIIFTADPAYNFWREKLKKDLVIISDDNFENFVTTSTEVITRTKISSETGTVQSGALWTEEYLPQDTILYSIAMTTAPRVSKDDQKGPFKGNSSDEEAQKVMKFLKTGLPETIHIGGNQTIGKGIVRIKLWEG